MLAARQSRVVSRYYDFVRSFSSLSPELISGLPPGNNVLVFAPHCDDEALGCGGTLSKHHLGGHALTAVFMTDGARCDSGLPEDEIVQTRMREARRAANVLGIDRCIFLGYPDRRLQKTEETVRRTESILKDVGPDLVYLPFYLDNHPDHMETAAICLEALRLHPVKTVFFYEVWTTLIPNRLVDITTVMEKKMEAVRVYRSQKGIDLFAEKIKALNRYRSLQSNHQYSEAFLKVSSRDLGKIPH